MVYCHDHVHPKYHVWRFIGRQVVGEKGIGTVCIMRIGKEDGDAYIFW